ncbi:MAG TPA: ABC transporter permease [Gemmatimonadaceae bacterium]|nr:ABC transporter permease [Gemmatimonadaceae bacterium]
MAASGWPDRRAAHVLAFAGALALLLAWRHERVFAAFTTPHADRWAASLFVLLALPASVALLIYDARHRRSQPAHSLAHPAVHGRSLLRLAWRRFAANRLAVASLYVIFFFYLVALVAPIIAGYDPSAIEDVLSTRYQAPSWQHPFGTDDFGRDLFSRAVYGARVSLSIGLLAMLVAVSFGTLYGAIAGYFGGAMDNSLMRLVDVIIAFPTFFLMLTLVGLFEANIFFLVLILGFTSWTGTARFVRGEILSLKRREFIEGARAIGLPAHLIIARHLIPNALAPVLVSAALMVGGMIGAEAGLSFLGIGIRPPTPSWGNMISAGQDALLVAWWIAFFPGCLLALTIISFSLLSDGLRDALDPKTLMRKYV